MTDVIAIGSEAFPLKLTAHGGSEYSKNSLINSGDFSTHRANLNEKHMKLPHEKGTFLNFYKLKQDEPLSFVTNVISNPHLSVLEIKLALYLYDLFQFEMPEGGVFLLDKGLNADNVGKFVGTDDFLYHSFPSESQPMFDLGEAVHFQNVMKDLHLEYSEAEVRHAVLNLHNFSYITVTEIGWGNIQARAARNITNLPKENRIYGLVIQLFPMMDEKDISSYWKPKERG
ncbi:hypothetical protein MHM95_09925 [Pseudoalteromonas sp. CnMc7-15]|uniref:hypothetical protein n=1 Tax=unclassified Pseudoalteromonas TaxID=194690 RepID=UPI001EF7199D|nr:hypothetical protein [Pseudoalteromonas sp. CnMc7-15]MCG7566608.1 hypothetical protein [Pseudoalteromonas sp. CnMc7-15]